MSYKIGKSILAISLACVYLNHLTQSNQFYASDNQLREKTHEPPKFSKLDLNGDGLITLEEFKQHKIPYGEYEEVFADIDTNGDTAKSECEFASHQPSRFRKK